MSEIAHGNSADNMQPGNLDSAAVFTLENNHQGTNIVLEVPASSLNQLAEPVEGGTSQIDRLRRMGAIGVEHGPDRSRLELRSKYFVKNYGHGIELLALEALLKVHGMSDNNDTGITHAGIREHTLEGVGSVLSVDMRVPKHRSDLDQRISDEATRRMLSLSEAMGTPRSVVINHFAFIGPDHIAISTGSHKGATLHGRRGEIEAMTGFAWLEQPVLDGLDALRCFGGAIALSEVIRQDWAKPKQ